MKRLPELVLVLFTIIWGGTFLATRTALHGMGPFTLLFIRFAIGAVLVGVFVRRRPSAREALGALIVSVTIAVAIAAQAEGLKTVGSARAGFLTAFYVPLVPILQGPITGRRASIADILGAIVAFVGLTLLAAGNGFSPSLTLGDVVILFGAVATALQVVLMSRFASDGDAKSITALQLAGVAMLSVGGATAEGMRATPMALSVAVVLGVVATAVGLFAMNWAQRTISPTRAALIYALEPVWAALFGFLAGEKLGTTALVGGGLVVVGALVGEFLPERWFATGFSKRRWKMQWASSRRLLAAARSGDCEL